MTGQKMKGVCKLQKVCVCCRRLMEVVKGLWRRDLKNKIKLYMVKLTLE